MSDDDPKERLVMTVDGFLVLLAERTQATIARIRAEMRDENGETFSEELVQTAMQSAIATLRSQGLTPTHGIDAFLVEADKLARILIASDDSDIQQIEAEIAKAERDAVTERMSMIPRRQLGKLRMRQGHKMRKKKK